MIYDIWLYRTPPSRISYSRSYRSIPVRISFQEVFLFLAVPGLQVMPVLTWKTMWKNKRCEKFRVWFFLCLRVSRFTFSLVKLSIGMADALSKPNVIKIRPRAMIGLTAWLVSGIHLLWSLHCHHDFLDLFASPCLTARWAATWRCGPAFGTDPCALVCCGILVFVCVIRRLLRWGKNVVMEVNALNQVHSSLFFQTKDRTETIVPDRPLSLHSGRPCLRCGTHCNSLAMWASTVGKEREMCVISVDMLSKREEMCVILFFFRPNQTNSDLCCLFRPLVVSTLPTAPETAPWIAPSFVLRTVPPHQLPHTKPHLYFHDSFHISLGLS